MPFSTDVTLPAGHTPVFPDRCVACGLPGPADTYRVKAEASGWLSWVLPWVPGRRPVVAVPACGPCAQTLRTQRWARAVLLWAAVIAGCVIAFALLPAVGLPVKRWTALPVVLLVIAPFAVWHVWSPPAFAATAGGESIDYEFRDAEYALEFAARNGGTVS